MQDSFLHALLTEVAKIIAILVLFMAVQVMRPAEEAQETGRSKAIPQTERVIVRSL